MTEIYDNNKCFVCGSNNAQGMKLKFHFNEKSSQVESEVIFPAYFQGWAGVVHGGIISTVLDEIMAKTIEHKNNNCVTAEITIKFKQPARTETRYILIGKLEELKRNIAFCAGQLLDKEKNIIATAKAKLFIIKKNKETSIT